jgi:hypothetical protein
MKGEKSLAHLIRRQIDRERLFKAAVAKVRVQRRFRLGAWKWNGDAKTGGSTSCSGLSCLTNRRSAAHQVQQRKGEPI